MIFGICVVRNRYYSFFWLYERYYKSLLITRITFNHSPSVSLYIALFVPEVFVFRVIDSLLAIFVAITSNLSIRLSIFIHYI